MTRAIDPSWFREHVVRVALKTIDLWSPAAEILVTGTALQESALITLHQVDGPALGFFQMEPATHDDIWRWLKEAPRPILMKLDKLMLGDAELAADIDELVGNAWYAAAMCRLRYAMVPEPLPEVAGTEPTQAELAEIAAYYKQHYNTPLGKATPEEFIANWRAAFPVAP